MRFYCFILLLVLSLLSCNNANPAAITSSYIKAKSEASNHVANAHVRRHFSTHERFVEEGNEDSFEERTINMKLPDAAKLQSLINFQPLKKLAANIQKSSSDNQKATKELFESLDVGVVGSGIFQSTPYQTWAKFVTKVYKKNPEAGQAAMFSILRDHYGDEPLAKLLAEARRGWGTATEAKQFESIQLDNWLAHEKTSDEVFSLLKLNVDEDDLLKNPLLSTWMSYEKKLGTENPNHALLLKLRERYDDAGLAKMLVAAKNDRSTQVIATHVERAQLESWLNGKKTTEDVFKLLRLNTDTGVDLLKNPALKIWMKYVATSGQNAYQLLLLKLRTKYSDEQLAKILDVAARDSNVRIEVWKLEGAQHNDWLGGRASADSIFKLLKLNKEGEELFKSPILDTWVNYVARLGKKNMDETMYSVMKKYYSDEKLEEMFAKAKNSIFTRKLASDLEQEMWRSQGKTADDIFKFLNLDKKDAYKLFDDPKIVTWATYVNRLNSLKKIPDDFALISELEKRFDDLDLARMLVYAHPPRETKSAITIMQELQFKKWRAKGWTPTQVESSLEKQSPDNVLNWSVRQAYKMFSE
ncbi:hypothetical protein F444_17362 [Phytophthora nicotianae P1976]|uniref:RxLR effector PexRD54 WY domain-containing protein n=1 Tax=Phytophthora nicotianae P1976 TaxID=1317066 RepID=A0A080ZF92_PHYNI|nr:hypothetical protein F444_17362 [Phytophthora nicotianae P1976]